MPTQAQSEFPPKAPVAKTRSQILEKISGAQSVEELDSLLSDLGKLEPEAIRARLQHIIRANTQNASLLLQLAYELEEGSENVQRDLGLAAQNLKSQSSFLLSVISKLQ